VLFELDKQGGYTLVLPPWSSGVLKLRGKAMRIADLWRKQARSSGKDGPLRLPLDASARGKLVLGETALLFQFAPPAPPPPQGPVPAGVPGRGPSPGCRASSCRRCSRACCCSARGSSTWRTS
jgi:hypothetical protein